MNMDCSTCIQARWDIDASVALIVTPNPLVQIRDSEVWVAVKMYAIACLVCSLLFGGLSPR